MKGAPNRNFTPSETVHPNRSVILSAGVPVKPAVGLLGWSSEGSAFRAPENKSIFLLSAPRSALANVG